ncbi:hypothetical protein LIER_41634 [Lithospermum erythrorhizon]|uniref:Pectinesterase inhibitor domain-containing protein n=1 Tax=Lithospermum erythrorhizon TaxID=34254 RepID=A0AAV3RC54_LITER
MASKSFNSFSLLSLAIFGAILLSQGLVEARGRVGVNPFCQKAQYFKLCNGMVKNAKTEKEASINAITSTRVLAAQIPVLTKAVTDTVNQGVTDPTAKESVIKQCTKVFQNAVEDLDLSLAAVGSDDVFTAATKLSAINLSDCSDAMDEFGVTLPMQKVVTQFQRQVSNCLAVVQSKQ